MFIKAVLFLIVGVAWLSLSGISRKIDTIEKVVLAAALGLASAMVTGAVAVLVRVSFDSAVDLFLVLAIVLVGFWLFTKPKLTLPRKLINGLSRYWLPLILFSFHLVLWIVYLAVYPYFPNSDAIDVVWHSAITNSVLHGNIGGPVATAGFPAGSHILFAFMSRYIGLDVLPALRVTAAVIESLSVLVAYCLFRRLFSSKLAADYASVAFALLIPSGFVYYARLGAYPNIVGDFFVLTSMLIALVAMENLTARSIVTAVLLEGTALVSHVSVMIFGGLVILFSLVVFGRYRSKFRAYLLSNLGFFILPIIGILFASQTVAAQITYVSTLYLDLNNNPVLILQQWLHNYLLFAGPLNFILLIAASIFVLTKVKRRLWPQFLLAWFTLLFLMVFVTTNDWRLVLLSLVPGAGLLGLLLSELHQTIRKLILPRIPSVRIWKKSVTVLMLFLMLILAAQGPTIYVMTQDVASGQTSIQGHIYDSMTWIRTNTSPDSAVLSVDLQKEYRYLPAIANRTYRGDFMLDSGELLKLQANFTFSFAAVSTHFDSLNSFYGSNSFREVYQNQDVVIFALTT